ncbi:Hypothetical protein NTJ_07518 [Nesidiocoris tenuis]|uniref:Uncharacterized protein n=1 Tax=Nesidiocoris tenuis TaxID=355587 RepID=A0ABN7ATT6_9HEMI|nr:Hypothetical protein NTJ_07518 [Nesidiocoris tenuis]
MLFAILPSSAEVVLSSVVQGRQGFLSYFEFFNFLRNMEGLPQNHRQGIVCAYSGLQFCDTKPTDIPIITNLIVPSHCGEKSLDILMLRLQDLGQSFKSGKLESSAAAESTHASELCPKEKEWNVYDELKA